MSSPAQTTTTTTNLAPPPPSPAARSAGMPTGEVINVAIFAGLIIILISSIVIILCKKEKKRTHPADYYVHPPSPTKVDASQPPIDYIIMMPPLEPPSVGGDKVTITSLPPMDGDPVIMISPLEPPPVSGDKVTITPLLPMDDDHVITMPPLEPTPIGGDKVTITPLPPMDGDHVIMMPPLESPTPTSDKQATMMPLPPPMTGHCSSENNKIIFTYEDLADATEGFSESNFLGEGGFGYVHKGVLPNGEKVAIKQLKTGNRQGDHAFEAEVATTSRVHHKHIASLVGYCTSGLHRMLVYEFVPNNTLKFHLHEKGGKFLSWDMRMKIAVGTAKGLANLHECQPKIIHRDIKSANILLDSNFEPKVADFGLARFYPETDTHVFTRVMGTFGYLAPEYALTGNLTEKSDVFSFGVMLLEIITGRKPIDRTQYLDDNIVDWARPLLIQVLEDENFDTLVDARLQNKYDHTEMSRMVACAAVCVRHLARRRPSMNQIAKALEGDLPHRDADEGIKPGHKRVNSFYQSLDLDTAQYREELKKFSMAFESRDISSEWSAPTSQPTGSCSEGLRTTLDLGSSIGVSG
ncbi:hypothetical protein R6Q59_012986 [Mikania micrantha]